MIRRTSHIRSVRRLLKSNPVVGIIGPRQVGKTTLAAQVAAAVRGPVHRFDLEDHRDRERLTEPLDTLAPLRGLIVLDEVQHHSGLFEALRVLADRHGTPARFLVLGSASPSLLSQSAESLAGRIAYHELGGFSLAEAGARRLDALWVRGGFPRSLLSATDGESFEWRQWLLRSFLERDLPQLGAPTATQTLRRFWTMLAHVHGQLWNSSDLARSFGVSDKTVRAYLEFLASTFMVRILPPWHENLAKRQVRSPKVYVRDTGLLHNLVGVRSLEELLSHPKCGASWEGFLLEQVLSGTGLWPEECFFWRTHTGAELDLLVVRGKQRLGFEFKRTSSPGLTPSMRAALEDLKLDRLWVIHGGKDRYPLGRRVEGIPARVLPRVVGEMMRG